MDEWIETPHSQTQNNNTDEHKAHDTWSTIDLDTVDPLIQTEIAMAQAFEQFLLALPSQSQVEQSEDESLVDESDPAGEHQGATAFGDSEEAPKRKSSKKTRRVFGCLSTLSPQDMDNKEAVVIEDLFSVRKQIIDSTRSKIVVMTPVQVNAVRVEGDGLGSDTKFIEQVVVNHCLSIQVGHVLPSREPDSLLVSKIEIEEQVMDWPIVLVKLEPATISLTTQHQSVAAQ